MFKLDFELWGCSFTYVQDENLGEGVFLRPGTLDVDSPGWQRCMKFIRSNMHVLWAVAKLDSLRKEPLVYAVANVPIESMREIEEFIDRSPIYLSDSAKKWIEQFYDAKNNGLEVKPISRDIVARQGYRSMGYVYLIKSPMGAFKIGRTKDPKDRIRTFSVRLPFEVEYECIIKAQDMFDLERQLHHKFEHKRVNGEWFNLDSEDVEYIKSLVQVS